MQHSNQVTKGKGKVDASYVFVLHATLSRTCPYVRLLFTRVVCRVHAAHRPIDPTTSDPSAQHGDGQRGRPVVAMRANTVEAAERHRVCRSERGEWAISCACAKEVRWGWHCRH